MRQLRAVRQAVAYLMGDASGLGFGLVMWRQRILASESGEFCTFYQGRQSNFREEYNLKIRIEQSVSSGELQDVELFVFANNMVFESVYYKGTLNSPLLFDIVLRLHRVQMKGGLILNVIHIAGKRIIEAGIDGLTRVKNLRGMMRGLNSLKLVPVDESEVEI